MAARPRKDRLPVNLYHDKRWNTFHYRNPQTGKKTSLGSDREAAIGAAHICNQQLLKGRDLVKRVMGGTTSLRAFIKLYIEEILPPRELAKSTLDLYELRLRQISEAFGDKEIDEVTLRDCAELLDSMPPRSSNQTRAIMMDLFNHAASKELCPDNPAAKTIKKIEKVETKRHTPAGLRAIRAASPQWLQNAIDIALLTGQRREDVLNMKFDDIQDGYLHVIQHKTKKHSDAGYLKIAVTPQLDAVIKRCRDSIASPYLIHRRPDRLGQKQSQHKEHWTKIEVRYLTRAFKKARDEAKPYPKYKDEEQPGFHQVRALSSDLHRKQGLDAQAMLGHTDEKMTKNYQRGHEEIYWMEVSADLDIAKITG